MSLEINLDISIERLQDEPIVLSLFEERMPIHGYPGVIDWELCGELSRLIAGRMFENKERSRMLLYLKEQCNHGRKVLVYGLGRRSTITPRKLSVLTEDLMITLSKLSLYNVVHVLPSMHDVNFDTSSLLDSVAYAILKFTSNQNSMYRMGLMWDGISKSDIIKSFKFATELLPDAYLSIIEKEE